MGGGLNNRSRAHEDGGVIRLAASLLVVTTVLTIGGGILLKAIRPSAAGALCNLHVISATVWMPVIAVHAVAHVRRVPTADCGRLAGGWRLSG